MDRKICLEDNKIVVREYITENAPRDFHSYPFKPHYIMVVGPYDASLIGPFISSNHAVEWLFVNTADTDFEYQILSQPEMEDNIREYSDIDFYTPEDFLKFLKSATTLSE